MPVAVFICNVIEAVKGRGVAARQISPTACASVHTLPLATAAQALYLYVLLYVLLRAVQAQEGCQGADAYCGRHRVLPHHERGDSGERCG